MLNAKTVKRRKKNMESTLQNKIYVKNFRNSLGRNYDDGSASIPLTHSKFH